jgi:hypothetical protein
MRIKHNDLTHWFIRDHDQLPDAYLRSCRKFFKAGREDAEMYLRQASSNKRQAVQLHKPGTRVKNRFNRKV